MKKILIGVIIILIMILTSFVLTNTQIKYTYIILIDKYFGDENIEYSSEYKINEFTISNSDYYFNQLTNIEQEIYSSLFNAVINLEDEFIINISDDNITYEELNEYIKNAVNNFFNDHPEVYYLESEYTMCYVKNVFVNSSIVEIKYTVNSMSELLNTNQEISLKVSEILTQISMSSTFDNALELHDYIASNIKYYDYSDSEYIEEEYHNINGAFLEEEAVCDGLSKALQIVLNKVGIDTIFVTGTLDNVSHGWIMMELEGDWYHVDVTADKYIVNEDNTVDFVSHIYYNLTTEDMLKSHSFEYEELLPEADSTKYNYYLYNDFIISKNDNFELKISNIVYEQNDNSYIEFIVENDGNIPDLIINALYDINFNDYKSQGNSIQMNYYNHENIYIIEN